MTGFRLGEYFERIGYGGKAEPTIETLRSLHRLHPVHIPYEAVDMLLGRAIQLEPAAIFAKLVTAGRGGSCNEQNILFREVLRALGFQVESLISRSRFGHAPDHPPARSHMVLRVLLDEQAWLADVGFGNWMLSAPIRLDLEAAQPTCFETVRLVRFEDERRLQAWLGGSWRPVYDIAFARMQDADFEVIQWHASNHPDSVFRRRLMVSRIGQDDRYALRDNMFTVRHRDGSIAQQVLSVAGLADCLAGVFHLPVTADWRPVLQAAVAAGAGG